MAGPLMEAHSGLPDGLHRVSICGTASVEQLGALIQTQRLWRGRYDVSQ